MPLSLLGLLYPGLYAVPVLGRWLIPHLRAMPVDAAPVLTENGDLCVTFPGRVPTGMDVLPLIQSRAGDAGANSIGWNGYAADDR